MNHKKIIIFFLLFLSFFHFDANNVESLRQKHQPVISEYFRLSGQMKLYSYIDLQNLFKVVNQVDVIYLKQLRKDQAVLKKIIKKKKKKKDNYESEVDLLAKLEKIYKFLKRYYLELEVMNFLDEVRNQWSDILQAVDEQKDILPLLGSKGIKQQGIKGLKIFVTKMNRLLGKVDDYENRLHSDFIDLKLNNYVLKIELIRIRNAAIFHSLYRGTPIVTSYPR
jgi:hypothetical protein